MEGAVANRAIPVGGEVAGEVGCVLLLEKVAVFGIAAEGSVWLVVVATEMAEVDN